jgi:di/tricarboxylate transporter
VIIVGSALVISAAVQRSGLIERGLALISGRVTKVRSQLLVLTASVGVTSALVKNVGALAMLMPAAFQMAKKNEASPSVFLMPMSFASLLGGLMTLVGTSPNIIVSRVRQDMTGHPFRMFDYFPTGFGLLVVGLIFLRFGYRLLPRDRRAAPTVGEAMDIKGYVTEATIGEGSPAIDETVDEFSERHDGDVTITSVLRAGMRSQPQPWMKLREGDTLIVSGEPDVLERVISSNKLVLAGEEREVPEDRKDEEIGVIEAVISNNSALIGRTASRMKLQQRLGINLIAVARGGERLTHRLGGTVLRAGDVIVLQGPASLLPERLPELGVLPLAERALRLGNSRKAWLPVSILAIAMIATATG